MKSIKPVLSHSQNFLNSNTLVKRLIIQSGITKEDVVYEIGPGKGIITKQLSDICSKVIAVEYDKHLYEKLVNDFREYENVELIFGDFIKMPLPSKDRFKIFSNIPFNITAEILSKITKLDNPPDEAFLIIQEEAAKKYAGFPYCNESLRSLILKPYFELRIFHKFKNTDFIPVPNVNIVLLGIKKRESYLINKNDYKKYTDFISYAFSQHGRDLKERLKKIFTTEQFKRLSIEFKFNISVRPVELNIDQWISLFKYFLNGVSKQKQAIVWGSNTTLINQQKKLNKVHRNRRSEDFRFIKGNNEM